MHIDKGRDENRQGSLLRICFIVEGYPTQDDPFMPFIRNTVSEMAKLGVECTVIAPQSITRALKHGLAIRPFRWVDSAGDNAKIEVLQPRYLSFSGKASRINQRLFCDAAKRAYRSVENRTDVLYAHFWHMGMIASEFENSKPLFVACGESSISVCERYPQREIDNLRRRVRGVIYVSSKSYDEARALGLQEGHPHIILPNGFDPAIFHCMDKEKLRMDLGWGQEDFIISYVGAFSHRKGVDRLLAALDNAKDAKGLFACLIGSGKEIPAADNILLAGKIPHKEIPRYLSASDLFVLPTLNEGCCNAIVEALACGVPVVSSDRSFNYDILDETNSVLVDPEDVGQIEMAIKDLVANRKKLALLAEGAIARSEKLTLGYRAGEILSFIRRNIK